jgi:hypothetical protein
MFTAIAAIGLLVVVRAESNLGKRDVGLAARLPRARWVSRLGSYLL